MPEPASNPPTTSADPAGSARPFLPLLRALQQHTAQLSPTTRALLWSLAAGALFSVLNSLARLLSQQLHPMQTQFLRYAFGVLLLLPLVWRTGAAAWWPRRLGAQFTRGAVHTLGLVLWFSALPRIPLADMTALGFTGPIFILIGAALFLKEPMRWERWVATALGFAGVMVVVGPQLPGSGGLWHLVMLASAPVFAASFLLTKVLTRTESPSVIVLWQSISVSLFSLPLALPVWQMPSATQWAAFALCGALGTLGHYCLTRAYRSADISATQSAKFLDLVWASLLGLALFGEWPTAFTLLGGGLIAAATLWLARREARPSLSA